MSQLHRAERTIARQWSEHCEARDTGNERRSYQRGAHRAERRLDREIVRAEIEAVERDAEADADDAAWYCHECGGPCTGLGPVPGYP